MKNKKQLIAKQYPYLAYWIEYWGEMETTNGQYSSLLTLLDEGGTCYEDKNSKTIDEAFEKAEKYLRKVESKRFDQDIIDSLEANYQLYGLK